MAERSGNGEPRFLDEEWCVVLRRAAKETTYRDIAAEAGYSRAHIAEIFGGRKRPTADELLRIAGALGLSQLRMLDLAGHLPGVSRLLTYLEQLEDQASRTQLAAASVPFDDVHGAAIIAGKGLASGRYRAVVDPLWQGTGEYRRHYADLVAFEPVQAMSAVEIRADLEELLHHEMAWFTAGFIGSPETARHLNTSHPELVINVPRFVAIRKGGVNPLVGVPHTISVIGGHWSGSADVASLLAHGFDYDYSHVGFVASRAFSRITHRWDHRLFDRDRLEVARTYVAGGEIGRSRVWAAGGDGYAETARLLAGDRRGRNPFVVHLRPTDELIDWTSWARTAWRQHGGDAETDRGSSISDRAVVDQQLAGLGSRVLTLDAGLPAGAVRDSDNLDAFMDHWCLLAETVAERLRADLHMRFDLDEALRRMRNGGR
ncbi:helix-turn-helix domain-containing protein [Pseudonocardia sp. RS010]|uniref:helix-turn-helix domain-containing protein n=1 Tax=Pseudonocardia sp. RS010 TaxID=3385979 RepID=UPI0039A22BD5